MNIGMVNYMKYIYIYIYMYLIIVVPNTRNVKVQNVMLERNVFR